VTPDAADLAAPPHPTAPAGSLELVHHCGSRWSVDETYRVLLGAVQHRAVIKAEPGRRRLAQLPTDEWSPFRSAARRQV
jgi:hypothetical protein